MTRAHLIHRAPKASNGAPPLLFIHGAFAGAWYWDEFFLPWFADNGFDAYAVDLPGRRGRPDFANLQEFTLSDYSDAVLEAVDGFETPPVLIGHSMGGYLAWTAAERRRVAGLVLMAPVPPTGLAAPALQLMVSNPELFLEVVQVHAGGGPGNVDALYAALFSDNVPREAAAHYLEHFQSESRLAVAGLYGAHIPNVLAIWGTPIKVVGAQQDKLIPVQQVHWTATIVGRIAHIYEGMGHSMMLEAGWQQVAEDIAEWLENGNLRAAV